MARNPDAETNPLGRALHEVQAGGLSARVRCRARRRRFVLRLIVLALALVAAVGVTAGTTSAMLSYQQHPRRLSLRLAHERGAPVLWVNAGTLHWSATAPSRQYVESRTTRTTTTYAVVAGTSDTPPAAAGATVTYAVRPRYQPRSWSNAITVAYTHHKREEREAREKAELEAKLKAELEAKEKAELEAKLKAELEAKEKAELEAKQKAELEAKEKAELEAKAGLPTHFAWGIGNVSGHLGWMLESGSKWDFANDYLSAGVNTAGGWEHWASGGGSYASQFAEHARADGFTPVLTYYNLFQSNGSCEGCGEAQKDFSNLNNASTMAAYYANFRLALEKLAPYEHAILHVEPDLSGYAEQAVLNGSCDGFCTGQGNNPSLLTASVASSGYAPVAGYANTYTGFNEALKHLRDLYAPKVLLAFHVSGWATRKDIDGTTEPVSGTELGKEAGEFAAKAGAGGYDVIFNDVANHDAANGGNWWDRLNVSVPNFARWESYAKAISEATGRKVIAWQVPEGNQVFDTMNNSTGHWQDNRAEYFFAHVPELVEHDIVGVIFGDGTAGTKVWDSVRDGITNPASFCTKAGLSSGEVCDTHVSIFADDDGGFIREHGLLYYASPYPLP
jgi:hypothetical protein